MPNLFKILSFFSPKKKKHERQCFAQYICHFFPIHPNNHSRASTISPSLYTSLALGEGRSTEAVLERIELTFTGEGTASSSTQLRATFEARLLGATDAALNYTTLWQSTVNIGPGETVVLRTNAQYAPYMVLHTGVVNGSDSVPAFAHTATFFSQFGGVPGLSYDNVVATFRDTPMDIVEGAGLQSGGKMPINIVRCAKPMKVVLDVQLGTVWMLGSNVSAVRVRGVPANVSAECTAGGVVVFMCEDGEGVVGGVCALSWNSSVLGGDGVLSGVVVGSLDASLLSYVVGIPRFLF